jgi:membrane-associated phospholipid phosphatase
MAFEGRSDGLVRRRALLKLGATAALGAATVPGLSLASTVGSQGAIEPLAGSWRTWFIPSGPAMRLPAPPDSAAELPRARAMVEARDAAATDRVAFWDAGSPAYRWNEIAIDMYFRNAFGPFPGPVERLLPRIQAYLNTAIHDATVATWDSKYAYRRPRPSELDPSIVPAVAVPRSPSYPSEHAAAAGAASEVLAHFAPKETEALQRMADEAAASRVAAGVQYPSDAAAGLDLGRRAASYAIDRAKNDNFDVSWSGQVPTGPGMWTGQNPVGAAERYWRPFIVPSADVLRPPPPPAFGSEQFAKELAEVKDFPRTPFTNGMAIWVEHSLRGRPHFNIRWNRELSQRVFEEHLEDNPWAARGYALLHAVYQDAWITTQDAKFTYWTARPTMVDPSIRTLIPVPNHPSYVSNGSALASGPSLILGYLFPRDAEKFWQTAVEFSEARLWAGIHFRSDIEASQRMGEQLAKLAIAHG